MLHLSNLYLGCLNNSLVYEYLESGGNFIYETLRNYILEANKKNILFCAIYLKINNKHLGNIKFNPMNLKKGWEKYGIIMGDVNRRGKGILLKLLLL